MLAVLDVIRATGGARDAFEIRDALPTALSPDALGDALTSLEAIGLIAIEPGGWILTPSAVALDVGPARMWRLLKALKGLQSGPLDAAQTYRAIVEAARAGRYVSYGDLAKRSGVPWSRARRPMSLLLGRLLVLGQARGWPMLSAIVVSRDDLGTGRLSPPALKGFAAAALGLGVYAGGDLERFVAECQAGVFAWARDAPDDLGLTPSSHTAFPVPTPREGGFRETNHPTPAPPYTAASIVAEGCFLPPAELEDIVARLRSKKNLILQGPPGTGKTWLARKLAWVLLGSSDRETTDLRVRVVQFHPSLAYEDFVRGWRPVNGQLQLADGVFLHAIDAALSEPDRPFVLVIEEINRGNPAQVLGEMLTLLEDSKRRPEDAVELAYPRDKPGGERIYIPGNLHVIGTMNVADRSLALVDLALRRRFAFVSLTPRLGPAWRDWAHRTGGLQPAMAGLIETRLDALNAMIATDRALGPQFRIGHSYVTPTGPVGGDGGARWFRSVVETEIAPLLDEYWFDQPDKVAAARADLLRDLP